MAQYARRFGEGFIRASTEGMIRNEEDILISGESLDTMTDEECAAFGRPRIPDPAPTPEGMVEFGRDLINVDGKPAWDITLAPAPTPTMFPLPNISDRQFSAGLCRLGMITFDEALAFTGNGTIPSMLQAMLDVLPDEALEGELSPRQDAMLFLAGAKEYEFAHPLVDVLRQAQGWTPEKLREEWTVWLTL